MLGHTKVHERRSQRRGVRDPDDSDTRSRSMTMRKDRGTLSDLSSRPRNFDFTDLLQGDSNWASSTIGFESTNWLLSDNFLDIIDSEYLLEPLVDSGPLRADRTRPDIHDLRSKWFVQVWELRTTTISALKQENRDRGSSREHDIDDACREDMASRLELSIREEPLPSISFLVTRSTSSSNQTLIFLAGS